MYQSRALTHHITIICPVPEIYVTHTTFRGVKITSVKSLAYNLFTFIFVSNGNNRYRTRNFWILNLYDNHWTTQLPTCRGCQIYLKQRTVTNITVMQANIHTAHAARRTCHSDWGFQWSFFLFLPGEWPQIWNRSLPHSFRCTLLNHSCSQYRVLI